MIITSQHYDNPTYVVCGTAFSGTSLVAGTLRVLGVPMGKKFTHPGTHQDIELSTWRSNRQRIAAVNRRNERYPAWGFKSVDMSSWLPDLLHHLREPVFLFCSRGLADTWKNTSSPYAIRDTFDLLSHLTEEAFWCNFFLNNEMPWCLLNYKDSPELLLDQILEFTRIECDDKSQALDFNSPEKGYTDI